jgi:hypothetical protein
MAPQPIARRRLDVPGQPVEEDRLLAMIAALASELAVTRERLDTVERLLERGGAFDRQAIETFVAEGAVATERETLRRRIIDRVFRVLRDAASRSTAQSGDSC